MKFADEFFEEIEAGTTVICIDEDDDVFTKGAEYLVQEDEVGLFIVDDGESEELFNEVLARHFAIKELDKVGLEIQLAATQLREAAAVKDLLLSAINGPSCAFCKHNRSLSICPNGDKTKCWEWRGPQL